MVSAPQFLATLSQDGQGPRGLSSISGPWRYQVRQGGMESKHSPCIQDSCGGWHDGLWWHAVHAIVVEPALSEIRCWDWASKILMGTPCPWVFDYHLGEMWFETSLSKLECLIFCHNYQTQKPPFIVVHFILQNSFGYQLYHVCGSPFLYWWNLLLLLLLLLLSLLQIVPLFLLANPATSQDWIYVDEAQDLNTVRMLLVKRLCKENTRVIAVGDPCQARACPSLLQWMTGGIWLRPESLGEDQDFFWSEHLRKPSMSATDPCMAAGHLWFHRRPAWLAAILPTEVRRHEVPLDHHLEVSVITRAVGQSAAETWKTRLIQGEFHQDRNGSWGKGLKLLAPVGLMCSFFFEFQQFVNQQHQISAWTRSSQTCYRLLQYQFRDGASAMHSARHCFEDLSTLRFQLWDGNWHLWVESEELLQAGRGANVPVSHCARRCHCRALVELGARECEDGNGSDLCQLSLTRITW